MADEAKRKWTPGPWDYVPGTEHHGPYVTSDFGSTLCDCYTMSRPDRASTLNGGPSKPLLFMHEMAEPNARLMAAAPDLHDALVFCFAALPSTGIAADKAREIAVRALAKASA